MSIWRIIFANLKHSRRQHLGTCLGLALASMVLVGSLTVGDSVQATLGHKAKERIGLITDIFLSTDGYFHSDLAERISKSDKLNHEVKLASVLMVEGTISSPDGKKQLGGITVLGIDQKFFTFTNDAERVPDLSRSGFWASPDLAMELGTQTGSRLVLRVEEPSLFSRDAPLSGERDGRFVSWNRPYLGEVTSSALGNFSLRSSMEPARTIFVPLSMLQEDMFVSFSPDEGRTDFANLLLVSTANTTLDPVLHALKDCWSLEDAGLVLKKLRTADSWNLRGRSVFLSDTLVKKVRQIEPMLQGELTYLVNAIRKPVGPSDSNSSLIPYSMVTGVEPSESGVLEAGWKKNSIAVNEWVAKDLNLSLGDLISLEYFVVGTRRELIEKSRSFTVKKILPMPEKVPAGKESDWTPRFPGLSDAENCGEWDTGIPIKHDIRAKDEHYWDEYRGTPKAFIALKEAQEMWGNRWGKYTGLKVNGSEKAHGLSRELLNKLSPSNFGLQQINIKKIAESSVSGPVDFSQLFLSFGFFVVLAGLSLGGLLFGFSLEQRNRQIGVLLSLGYTLARVKFIIWMEAGFVCLLGTFMGLGWAWFFGRAVLGMLNGAWGGVVAKLNLFYAPSLESVILGTSVSLLLGLGCLFWTTRQQCKNRPVQLMQAGEFINPYNLPKEQKFIILPRKWLEGLIWTILALLALYSLLFEFPAGPGFFGIGALFLIGSMMRIFQNRSGLSKINHRKRSDLLLNLDYRQGRKTTVIGILAVGTFLVVGAGAFRQELPEQSTTPKSATGGFSYIIKTSLPLYDDLLSREASELYDLNAQLLDGSVIVPIRSEDGDDASCLNLYQSKLPPLYGLPISEMHGRFNFAAGNWKNLEKPSHSNLLFAAVDQNTMMWSLKKKIGDRITYLDGSGEEFEVELAAVLEGSFLQGGLYVSEKKWLEKFPRRGGYNTFLVGGTGLIDRSVSHLNDRLLNYGPRVQSTLDRLGQFKKVENTYLSIFQALGGLGVLLGTLGLLIVVLRNLWERKKEQAILGAVGFSLEQLQTLAIRENMRIIFLGLSLGFLAGLLGLIPVLSGNATNVSIYNIIGFGVSLLIFSFFSLFLAVRIGLPHFQIQSLRNE